MKGRINRRFLALTEVKFSVLTIQDAEKGPLKCSDLQFCGGQNVTCRHSDMGKGSNHSACKWAPRVGCDFLFFFGLLLMFLYLLSETLQHSWSSCFKSFFKLEMDLKIKNQPIARAGGQSEEAYGMTSVSQKYKGGKSLGITQTYELNQWTICLVRNKKKPSAKIFLVRGTARAKIIFYGGKLHVNGICKNDFWKDSRNISFKCQWCAISQ